MAASDAGELEPPGGTGGPGEDRRGHEARWPEWRRSLAGVVEEFDGHRGLGTVATAGGERYRFHCTAVADGSRHVEVGVAVRFSLAGAHGGTVEARDVAPVARCAPEPFLEG